MLAARLASQLIAPCAPLAAASSSVSVSQRFASSGKDVRYGTEARQLLLQGIDKLTDAVKVTLGPRGRHVIIDQAYGQPKITKDGVTVARSIELADRYQNLGAQLVRSVASRTNDQAGDGTTTATILARAIFAEGCKAVAAGMNPMDLKRGIDLAVDHVTKNLKTLTKQVSTQEEIAQVCQSFNHHLLSFSIVTFFWQKKPFRTRGVFFGLGSSDASQ